METIADIGGFMFSGLLVIGFGMMVALIGDSFNR